MNEELARIEEQLRRAFEGEAWHGPSVLEVLEGVAPEDAHAHPVAGAHSIWELVFHLAGTYRLVLRRLRGDATPLASEEDWPPDASPTRRDWDAAIRTLRELNQEVRRAVLGFAPGRLDQPLVAEPPYTAFTQFVGLTQHDLYHAGQMALLKRALAPETRSQASGAPPEVVLKRFEAPDETRTFEKGRFEIVRLGSLTLGRATYQPGWRWSVHVGPDAGASRCSVEHVGMVLSGVATVAFDDGRVIELREGSLFHVPAVPHDSWVVGEAPYVSLHFIGAERYARS